MSTSDSTTTAPTTDKPKARRGRPPGPVPYNHAEYMRRYNELHKDRIRALSKAHYRRKVNKPQLNKDTEPLTIPPLAFRGIRQPVTTQ